MTSGYRLCGLIAASLLFHSCLPPAQEDFSSISYSTSDPEYRNIKNLQDKRLTDSLALYLKHPKASYRLLAAEAYGSFKDSLAVPMLLPLLNDPVEAVRQACIFSLGQTGYAAAEPALIKAFIPVDSTGPYMRSNAMILEALGKCGTDSTLQLMCKLQSYKNARPELLQGLMAGFFRFGLRNKICQSSIPLIVEVATNKNYPDRSRLLAVHFLQRFKTLDLKPHYKELRNASFEEKNPHIRMGLISALASTGTSEALGSLEELYSRILDTRIQCNLIRGLQQFPNGMASGLAIKALQNPSSEVSLLAAEYLNQNATESQADEMMALVREGNLPWPSRSLICQGLIRTIPFVKKFQRQAVYDLVLQSINKSESPYEKAAYIRALERSAAYLPYLLQMGMKEKDHYVLTAITETVRKIYQSGSINIVFKESRRYIYQQTTDFLHLMCNKPEQGSMAVIAEWFEKDQGALGKYFKPDSTLSLALSSLSLPRDIETYNAIEKTMSKLSNRKHVEKKPDYNHPIDWSRLNGLSDTIKGEIVTAKGKLEFELYPALAPGSVVNFLDLCEKKFFDGKIIHRLVPNFVIQTGCPRGDGYGSLDYSIRTECVTTLDYEEEGMIGMASAGPDTECSQFFITYSPAPHLDGRYSVFGRMTHGMDIMTLFEQGDKITEVHILR